MTRSELIDEAVRRFSIHKAWRWAQIKKGSAPHRADYNSVLFEFGHMVEVKYVQPNHT